MPKDVDAKAIKQVVVGGNFIDVNNARFVTSDLSFSGGAGERYLVAELGETMNTVLYLKTSEIQGYVFNYEM